MNSVFVKGKLPSLNEYIRACRTSPQVGAKMKRETERIIIYQLARLDKITSPVIVRFVWYEENKKRDKDNVAFGKKFILDAMQASGKLVNDNNDYIAGFTDDFVYREGQGVKITIERMWTE